MDRLRPNGYLCRLKKELSTLSISPPEGIQCWPRENESVLDEVAQEQSNKGFWIDASTYLLSLETINCRDNKLTCT
jgi:hypothetical protein